MIALGGARNAVLLTAPIGRDIASAVPLMTRDTIIVSHSERCFGYGWRSRDLRSSTLLIGWIMNSSLETMLRVAPSAHRPGALAKLRS
jgi:hypothetical protein